MVGPTSPNSSDSRRPHVPGFMVVSLLVMAAVLTLLGLQLRGGSSHLTPASPSSAPTHESTPARGGGDGGASAPTNPGADRNG